MARLTRSCSPPRRRRASGFTLVWCLAMVAVMGVYLMKVGDAWQMRAQREREVELRQRGTEIREAIRRYVENGSGRYPETLADLVEDNRTGQVRRWLRKPWDDPMTGADWQYLPAPGDGFMGVHSGSARRPLRQDGFYADEPGFAEAESYADWRFAYWPGQTLRDDLTPP